MGAGQLEASVPAWLDGSCYGVLGDDDACIPWGESSYTTRYTTRNVLINDEYLMTLTIFVIELVYSMTKLVASSCLIRDGALVRRTVTENRINVTK